jgi:glycosyltransferase involved in cell wall biosynthesis
LKRAVQRLALERDVRIARRGKTDLAIFHDFQPAPAGGGHQSLRTFVAACQRRGLTVETNAISSTARACLFNSFNFDFARLERFAAERPDGCLMVHRVGAVTSLYRGFDDGTDARVGALNARLADRTLAISHATVAMYRQIGIDLVDPHVVHNPVDPTIFHPRGRIPWSRARKTRIICSAWSDNPRKGGPVYRWLESELDWERFEFTFVGNAAIPFERVRHVPALPSHELAELLRQHDVFITATEHDAYSNALIEALSCGLPALYLLSGGSAEAVKDAGFGFAAREEIPALLEQLVAEYEDRQAAIDLPSLDEVVDGYLAVLGLEEYRRA